MKLVAVTDMREWLVGSVRLLLEDRAGVRDVDSSFLVETASLQTVYTDGRILIDIGETDLLMDEDQVRFPLDRPPNRVVSVKVYIQHLRDMIGDATHVILNLDLDQNGVMGACTLRSATDAELRSMREILLTEDPYEPETRELISDFRQRFGDDRLRSMLETELKNEESLS
jgi:hypothetical protein